MQGHEAADPAVGAGNNDDDDEEITVQYLRLGFKVIKIRNNRSDVNSFVNFCSNTLNNSL